MIWERKLHSDWHKSEQIHDHTRIESPGGGCPTNGERQPAHRHAPPEYNTMPQSAARAPTWIFFIENHFKEMLKEMNGVDGRALRGQYSLNDPIDRFNSTSYESSDDTDSLDVMNLVWALLGFATCLIILTCLLSCLANERTEKVSKDAFYRSIIKSVSYGRRLIPAMVKRSNANVYACIMLLQREFCPIANLKALIVI